MQFRLLARGGISRNDNRYQWWDEFTLDYIISANVTIEMVSYYTNGNYGFFEVEFYTGESEYPARHIISFIMVNWRVYMQYVKPVRAFL